jgi:hypothetical protein
MSFFFLVKGRELAKNKNTKGRISTTGGRNFKEKAVGDRREIGESDRIAKEQKKTTEGNLWCRKKGRRAGKAHEFSQKQRIREGEKGQGPMEKRGIWTLREKRGGSV